MKHGKEMRYLIAYHNPPEDMRKGGYASALVKWEGDVPRLWWYDEWLRLEKEHFTNGRKATLSEMVHLAHLRPFISLRRAIYAKQEFERMRDAYKGMPATDKTRPDAVQKALAFTKLRGRFEVLPVMLEVGKPEGSA